MSSLRKTINLFKGLNSFKDFSLKKNSGGAYCLQKTSWRSLSSTRFPLQATVEQNSKKAKLVTEEERLQFDNLFPKIVEDLVNNKLLENLEEITPRFIRSLKYNVPNGKKIRGLAVVASYMSLEKPDNLTNENIRLANILGWAVEMMQAFFLVLDDLTDGSETRRGEPCWYKHQDIGLTAINDGLLLENSLYMLLKKYFSHHPCYIKLVELFHESSTITTLGQMLDCNILNVSKLTMNRYDLIVSNKTAFYSFYLPVALALYLSNNTNSEIHQHAKKILIETGKFFQVQDDFLDCFGDPNVTGKIGTDIETGKCTWLAAKAMEVASVSQKKLMEEHYGKQNPDDTKKIKELYVELDIPKLFEEFEELSFKRIQSYIQNLPQEMPHELFDRIMANTYKRIC